MKNVGVSNLENMFPKYSPILSCKHNDHIEENKLQIQKITVVRTKRTNLLSRFTHANIQGVRTTNFDTGIAADSTKCQQAWGL